MTSKFHRTCTDPSHTERYADGSCALCKRAYAKNRKLAIAAQTWQPWKPETESAGPIRVRPEVDWLKCNQCGERLENARELMIHKRAHSGISGEHEQSYCSSPLSWTV